MTGIIALVELRLSDPLTEVYTIISTLSKRLRLPRFFCFL